MVSPAWRRWLGGWSPMPRLVVGGKGTLASLTNSSAVSRLAWPNPIGEAMPKSRNIVAASGGAGERRSVPTASATCCCARSRRTRRSACRSRPPSALSRGPSRLVAAGRVAGQPARSCLEGIVRYLQPRSAHSRRLRGMATRRQSSRSCSMRAVLVVLRSRCWKRAGRTTRPLHWRRTLISARWRRSTPSRCRLCRRLRRLSPPSCAGAR